jgi:DNA (cytosine-5)-methyltransferase 1
MAAYYNEIEPFAAEWMRNLIKKGLIADGEVDERSIVDVRPDDLREFTQCHFFAGIGGWSHALRLAGWPDDRPIWTGSCPCQPFSAAGRRLGEADPRHLWPHFHRLIAAVRPPVVMGEQVAGAAGYGWLDGVRADLEGENYACRGVDIPACAVDAPHIRQRLYWVAKDLENADRLHGKCGQVGQSISICSTEIEKRSDHYVSGRCSSSHMDDTNDAGLEGHPWDGSGRAGRARQARSVAETGSGDMADSDSLGRPHERLDGVRRQSVHDADGRSERGDMADADNTERRSNPERWSHDDNGQDAGRKEAAGGRQLDRAANGSFWSNAIWLTGADGKARRAEPSIPLLAHGIPGRVGRLRAYGNAIVPPLAAEVIRAFMDVEAGELPPSSFPFQGE